METLGKTTVLYQGHCKPPAGPFGGCSTGTVPELEPMSPRFVGPGRPVRADARGRGGVLCVVPKGGGGGMCTERRSFKAVMCSSR